MSLKYKSIFAALFFTLGLFGVAQLKKDHSKNSDDKTSLIKEKISNSNYQNLSDDHQSQDQINLDNNRKSQKKKLKNLLAGLKKNPPGPLQDEATKELIEYYDDLNIRDKYRNRYSVALVLATLPNEFAKKKVHDLAREFGHKDINFLSTILSKLDLKDPYLQSTLQFAEEVLENNRTYILDESFKNVGGVSDRELKSQIQDSWFHSSDIKNLEKQIAKSKK
jgi:hypothetical protein